MPAHAVTIVTTSYRHRCAALSIAAGLLVANVIPASARYERTAHPKHPATSTALSASPQQRAPRTAGIAQAVTTKDVLNHSKLRRRGGTSTGGVMALVACVTATFAAAAWRQTALTQRLRSGVI